MPPATTNSTVNGTHSESTPAVVLPLPPRITPALSVAGVFLILTGVVYALIGVKNRWVHVFLSTAYLASLAVLVLIIYVMNPPVSNVIQGAYFVGVFMSGLIFGGGALVFKEVTEGLGCLLGGFCLSMWFLTLKAGGLITDTGGKAVFIAVFAVVCWSFSFSHYTRAYGLMFSTSFAGSTAFVIGIDCFSRGGLKEFWVYVWDLNDALFPLNTNSYPITRGTRVETVIIILGTIIGIISQLRVWKVVQDRQKQRAEAQAEDIRRRDAVEEALGRHLERQNDRDRSEWEKRYGDRLNAKRSTVLYSENHGDKRYSTTSITDVELSQNSESNESLEMASMQPSTNAAKGSLHSSRSKRQANITVQAIPEVEEEDQKSTEKQSSAPAAAKTGESLNHLIDEKFSFEQNSHSIVAPHDVSKTAPKESQPQLEIPQSLRPQSSKPASTKVVARLNPDADSHRRKNRSSVQSFNDLKRRSLQSLRSKSPANGDKPPTDDDFSESREALVLGAASTGTHSRASSVAATMDQENEKLEMPTFEHSDGMKRDGRPPQIIVSQSLGVSFADQFSAGLPPSPSGYSDQFDVDPEELRRPPAVKTSSYINLDIGEGNRRGNGVHADLLSQDGGKSSAGASNASSGEGLTKGALDRVPSQLSNVVLSYRTNEWAKHIATAEAPVYEEPEPIVPTDSEAPTHLATPALQTGKKLEVVEKPPLLPSPVTSVAPSDAGVKVNPVIQPPEGALVSPTADAVANAADAPAASSQSDPAAPSSNPSSAMPSPNPDAPARPPSSQAGHAQRSFTDPTQQAPVNSKTHRRISNPMQRQPSILQSTPIHENYATEFASRNTGPNRTNSNATSRSPQPYYANSPTPIDPYQQQHNYPSAFQRNSVTMHHSYSQPDIRPSTAQDYAYGMQNMSAMRSETRLGEIGGRTHQPLQRNNTDDSKREILMADWRMQLANSQPADILPRSTPVENHRYAQQMLDWEAEKYRKEQDRFNKARLEAAMDQTMRTQGMIDAHREVMRRMQSQANQKIGK